VNAYEAEARRISRFWAWGHTAGEVKPPAWAVALRARHAHAFEHAVREPEPEAINPDYPYTLDLRRLPAAVLRTS
jgi:uncharacterized protein (DUF2126 family)